MLKELETGRILIIFSPRSSILILLKNESKKSIPSEELISHGLDTKAYGLEVRAPIGLSIIKQKNDK